MPSEPTTTAAYEPLPIESRAGGREIIRRPKLVRDWIPDLIREHGDVCDWRVMTQDEFIDALFDKLVEEANEARDCLPTQSPLEEIADVQAVIDALLPAIGHTRADLEAEMQRKRDRAGTFSRRILLEAWTWTGAHLAGYHQEAGNV